MTHKETILSYLKEHTGPICDDCLSDMLKIRPRQTINQNARELAADGLIHRTKEKFCCSECKRDKLVNSY